MKNEQNNISLQSVIGTVASKPERSLTTTKGTPVVHMYISFIPKQVSLNDEIDMDAFSGNACSQIRVSIWDQHLQDLILDADNGLKAGEQVAALISTVETVNDGQYNNAQAFMVKRVGGNAYKAPVNFVARTRDASGRIVAASASSASAGDVPAAPEM